MEQMNQNIGLFAAYVFTRTHQSETMVYDETQTIIQAIDLNYLDEVVEIIAQLCRGVMVFRVKGVQINASENSFSEALMSLERLMPEDTDTACDLKTILHHLLKVVIDMNLTRDINELKVNTIVFDECDKLKLIESVQNYLVNYICFKNPQEMYASTNLLVLYSVIVLFISALSHIYNDNERTQFLKESLDLPTHIMCKLLVDLAIDRIGTVLFIGGANTTYHNEWRTLRLQNSFLRPGQTNDSVIMHNIPERYLPNMLYYNQPPKVRVQNLMAHFAHFLQVGARFNESLVKVSADTLQTEVWNTLIKLKDKFVTPGFYSLDDIKSVITYFVQNLNIQEIIESTQPESGISKGVSNILSKMNSEAMDVEP